MAIHISQNNDIVIGASLPLNRFSELAAEHKRRFTNTTSVEAIGRRFREDGYRESDLETLINAVCGWGGYAGIAARILRQNERRTLSAAFQNASHLLDSLQPDIEGALTRINSLHSLGTPSFASKHLRFLRPDICPVFDGILRDALPYSFDPEGYAMFARDCKSISLILQAGRFRNPWDREGGTWFAADVEAALYVHFNGWA